MQALSLYFEKYKNLGHETRDLKNGVIEIIQKICGVDIDSKKIKIINSEIKIEISGPAKSQILINKRKITKELEDFLIKKGIKGTKKIT